MHTPRGKKSEEQAGGFLKRAWKHRGDHYLYPPTSSIRLQTTVSVPLNLQLYQMTMTRKARENRATDKRSTSWGNFMGCKEVCLPLLSLFPSGLFHQSTQWQCLSKYFDTVSLIAFYILFGKMLRGSTGNNSSWVGVKNWTCTVALVCTVIVLVFPKLFF